MAVDPRPIIFADAPAYASLLPPSACQERLIIMKSKLCLPVVVLLVSANAFAQGKTTVITTVDGQVTDVTMVDRPPPARAFNTFTETDADLNGKIDREEARNAGILSFSKADLNGDGWLDKSEYEAVAGGTTKLPPAD